MKTTPLDPRSEQGRRIAADLTSALATVELAIAERRRRAHLTDQQEPVIQQQAA